MPLQPCTWFASLTVVNTMPARKQKVKGEGECTFTYIASFNTLLISSGHSRTSPSTYWLYLCWHRWVRIRGRWVFYLRQHLVLVAIPALLHVHVGVSKKTGKLVLDKFNYPWQASKNWFNYLRDCGKVLKYCALLMVILTDSTYDCKHRLLQNISKVKIHLTWVIVLK